MTLYNLRFLLASVEKGMKHFTQLFNLRVMHHKSPMISRSPFVEDCVPPAIWYHQSKFFENVFYVSKGSLKTDFSPQKRGGIDSGTMQIQN
jgi:hypothetical protein